MKWPGHWPFSLLALLFVSLETQQWSRRSIPVTAEGVSTRWTNHRKIDLREKTRDLWYHGYTSYMRFAFPLDELAPLSCTGRGPDWHNPANIATNDVAGNFSVTLVDVLDTFIVLNDTKGFEAAVRHVIDWVSFDVNTKPQVFETTIRVLGGLLSGHQFANQTGQPFYLPWYHGELLALARDLGNRLLPAFTTTPTGIPLARLNLRHGVSRGESADTCTAGAGSLILEFGTLSRLTGDDRFEKAAYKAFFALWNRKSAIGLVGNTINTRTGSWLYPEVSSIGAGIDSFYEYALKWYILSGEVEFLDVWQASYAAVMRYARSPDGFWYRSVNIHTGDLAYATFDSLSAFWPGLQVLAGDIPNAIKSHLIYWNLWKTYSGLPEVYDMKFQQAVASQYPLRPEFVESTWYLYRATRDPFYLDVGERIFYDIVNRAKVECGLTGISNLSTNSRDDRMESFVLSETLKYLYLLFDEANPLHFDDSNYVLTTEGHLLMMHRDHQRPMSAARRKLRGAEHLQCPVHQTPFIAQNSRQTDTALWGGVRSRPDVDYARQLVGGYASDAEANLWDPEGWCEVPQVELYSYEFILTSSGKNVSEDLDPTTDKIEVVSDGYIVYDVTGLRVHIGSRLDGKGYDVTRLGPYAVKPGQIIYVGDPSLASSSGEGKGPVGSGGPQHRAPRLGLRISTPSEPLEPKSEVIVTAYTALFGGDPSPNTQYSMPINFARAEGVVLSSDQNNPFGCSPYERLFNGEAVVLHRGECTFLEKLRQAKIAGASGVVAISEESAVHPSADVADLKIASEFLGDVAIIVVNREDGNAILQVMESAGMRGSRGAMMVVLPQDSEVLTTDQSVEGTKGSRDHMERIKRRKRLADPDSHSLVYLSGHPLINTRLLV